MTRISHQKQDSEIYKKIEKRIKDAEQKMLEESAKLFLRDDVMIFKNEEEED